MQRSDRDANELYYKHEKLVKSTLNIRFRNHQSFAKTHGLDKDDLLQLGKIGLFKAAQSYDSSKGASFKTYARDKISYTIQTEAKKYSINNKTNRSYDLANKTSMEYPLATSDGEVVDLHDVVGAVDNTFDDIEMDIVVENVSDAVSEDVANIVKLRYKGFTFKEIADLLDVTPQYVQQRLKQNREILSDYLLA